MGEVLKKWLKMKRDVLPRTEVILNLAVAANLIKSQLEKFLNEHGITEVQFNALRILKGVYPEGHPRCEIISRMIDRAPDITRLIDRLEKQGLVERTRNSRDRRHSITRISRKGISLLDKIQPQVDEQIKHNTQRLTVEECRALSRLTEKLYEGLI